MGKTNGRISRPGERWDTLLLAAPALSAVIAGGSAAGGKNLISNLIFTGQPEAPLLGMPASPLVAEDLRGAGGEDALPPVPGLASESNPHTPAAPGKSGSLPHGGGGFAT